MPWLLTVLYCNDIKIPSSTANINVLGVAVPVLPARRGNRQQILFYPGNRYAAVQVYVIPWGFVLRPGAGWYI